MKKTVIRLLCVLLLVALSLSIMSCGSEREVTPDELAAEYRAHGYQVTVMERGENEYGNTYTVQAVAPDGEGGYTIFEFFQPKRRLRHIMSSIRILQVFSSSPPSLAIPRR